MTGYRLNCQIGLNEILFKTFARAVKAIGKNKMDIINFSEIYDKFGEDAVKDTFNDMDEGKFAGSTLEKYLYREEIKEEYSVRLKKEYEDFE